jgi:hypothetical protein
MTPPTPREIYERTMKMLGPALERVASDAEFRDRLEANPLAALAELNIDVDADTRRELEGKRFSEFWALRRQAAEGVVGVRDLPPESGQLSDEQLAGVSGGLMLSPDLIKQPLSPKAPIVSFAPPYVPVAPSGGDF